MNRLATILAPLAFAGALSACAYEPAPVAVNPYQGNAYAAAPYTAAPYAVPVPAPVARPYAPAYGTPYAAVRPDPTGYCAESYAQAVDAGSRAAYTGNPVDVGRAQNTAGFYNRDCR